MSLRNVFEVVVFSVGSLGVCAGGLGILAVAAAAVARNIRLGREAQARASEAAARASEVNARAAEANARLAGARKATDGPTP